MKSAGVSGEDAEDRVEWKLKTRVAEPKWLGEKAKYKKKNE